MCKFYSLIIRLKFDFQWQNFKKLFYCFTLRIFATSLPKFFLPELNQNTTNFLNKLSLIERNFSYFTYLSYHYNPLVRFTTQLLNHSCYVCKFYSWILLLNSTSNDRLLRNYSAQFCFTRRIFATNLTKFLFCLNWTLCSCLTHCFLRFI